jgi:hypothetical protein
MALPYSFDEGLADPLSRLRDTIGDIQTDNILKGDDTYEGYLRLYGVALDAPLVTTAEKKATRDMLRAVAAQVGRSPSDARAGSGEGATWTHRVPTWLRLADALALEIQAEEEVITSDAARRGGSLLPAAPTYAGAL